MTYIDLHIKPSAHTPSISFVKEISSPSTHTNTNGYSVSYYILRSFLRPALKVTSICEGNYQEIIGDHQCGFRRNRSTFDHIFCIRQILEKKWEYNEEVHHLLIDFKKGYDSVRREALYKILIEFDIPRKLVRLIKMSLTETYSRESG